MNMDEFVDLCILCGCDYTNTIRGIGPTKAFNYISKCKNLEKVIEVIQDENENINRK